MTLHWSLLTGVTCVCLAMSFLLSGMETGVLSLNRLRLRQRMRAGNKRARLLHRFLAEPEPFLWTILVGNTLANFTAAVIIFYGLNQLFVGQSLAFAIGGLIVALGFYLLGELVPKTLFGLYPNRMCLYLITPFRIVDAVLKPIVGLVEIVARGCLRFSGGRVFTGKLFGTREELRWLMQESGKQFTTEERTMINRVMDLQKLTVRSRFIPMSEVISVDEKTPMHDVLAFARKSHFTRMPVWEVENGKRRVSGLISLKRLLFEAEIDPAQLAEAYMKPALYMDEDKRLEDALQLLQKSGHRMAIVLGRDKKETGIICLEDILKVIFGEVRL